MKQQACAPLSSDFSASFSFMRRAALDFFPFFCYNFFMTELFYAPRGGTSRDFVSRVLGDCYGFGNATFSRSASGKPLCDAPVCFSLSHTREYFFLAVSEKEVGADAESLSRRGDFSAIISRLPESERARALASPEEFLKLWTEREAVAKYLSAPVFSVFGKITLECGEDTKRRVFLNGKELPVRLFSAEIAGHAVAICAENNEQFGKIHYLQGDLHQ